MAPRPPLNSANSSQRVKAKSKQNPSENEQTRDNRKIVVSQNPCFLNLGTRSLEGTPKLTCSDAYRNQLPQSGAPMLRRATYVEREEENEKVHVWAGRFRYVAERIKKNNDFNGWGDNERHQLVSLSAARPLVVRACFSSVLFGGTKMC